MERIRFSIITVVKNGEEWIRSCMDSVLVQDYPYIEHIVMDGASTDNTVAICEGYKKRYSQKGCSLTIVSKSDTGIYNAMNNGIVYSQKNTKTNTVIHLLNSDDYYSSPRVLSSVAELFCEKPNTEIIFTGIQLVTRDLDGTMVKRVNSSSRVWLRKILGWCPPHPGLFCRSEVYQGNLYPEDFKIAGDNAWLLKQLRSQRDILFSDLLSVSMRIGGVSALQIRNLPEFMKSFSIEQKKYRESERSMSLNGYPWIFVRLKYWVKVAHTLIRIFFKSLR